MKKRYYTIMEELYNKNGDYLGHARITRQSIKFVPSLFLDVHEVAEMAVSFTKKRKLPVTFVFNDVTVQINPSQTLSTQDVVREYYKYINQRA